MPLITGELGENDCGHSFVDGLMSWLDSERTSYLAWTWNTWNCSTGPALISNYTGTATAYGAGYKTHLQSLSSGGGTSGYVRITNRATGLYVDGMGRTSDGSNAGQYSSTIKFQNRATGSYIDGDGRTANGSDLGQWSNSSSYNQQWQIVSG